MKGDLIVKLDDTPVKGMSLNDAVKRMRGKPRTDIILHHAQGRVAADRDHLTREVIKVQSVKSKVVEPGFRLPAHRPVPGEHRRVGGQAPGTSALRRRCRAW